MDHATFTFPKRTQELEKDMNEVERFLAGMDWLHSELAKTGRTGRRIENCEQARDRAEDPDIKTIWAAKAQQLKHVCPECHGNGYVAVDVNDAGTGPVYEDCHTCDNQGELEPPDGGRDGQI
jgi:hypothetical protein